MPEPAQLNFNARFFDYLQNYPFHIADISPSARPPFYTLGLGLIGFQSVSMPEVTLDTVQVSEVASSYKSTYFTGASVSPITLTRGSLAIDSSFAMWIRRSISGRDRVARHFVLLQFQGYSYSPDDPHQGTALTFYRPMGKGWLLWNCVPTRFRAGSDLDATSGDVSMMELEIQPQYFTEFSLDPLQLLELGS